MLNNNINTKYAIDDKDKAILMELIRNTRAPISIIAENTKMLRDTVRYRIRKMQEIGLIKEYHLILEPKTLGLEYFANILIKTEVLSEIELLEFHVKLKDMPNITHITKLLGDIDLLLNVAAKDAKDFEKIVNEIRSIPGKVIKNMDICTIVDEIKIDDFSKLI
jgi:DNA-binding Lrp family transcriptional regulator